ncbi:MAG: SIP domain-containing protein [Pseudomonadota bacterium]
MTNGFSASLNAEIEEVVEHFNANHADTLTLIARVLIPRDDAVETQISAVAPAHITLTTSCKDHITSVDDVPLTEPKADLIGLQQNVLQLIASARLKAGNTIPATSMEEELARTATLITYHTQVAAVRDLTPTLREITVSGGLEQFVYPGSDAFVFVLTPHASVNQLPDGFDMADFRTWQGDDKPGGAYYTIRHAGDNELCLWFVLHDDHGASASWAARAQVGDKLALWGPRTAFAPPPDATHYLLIGDETAAPALSVITEELASTTPIRVLLEAQNPALAPPFPERLGTQVDWVYRGDVAAGQSTALLEQVKKLDIERAGLFVFGAAETRTAAEIRRYLRTQHQLDLRQMHLTGYWRRR